MRTIPLTQGFVALVDDDDYDRINAHKWFARKTKNSWYAVRNPKWPLRGSVYMHREVLETPPGVKTDHQDGNGLNNQKDNIRPATTIQNGQSFCRLRINKAIPYRGFSRKREKFRARIVLNGEEISLGSFPTPESAAVAYDCAARTLFGEFASPNFT